jgi:uncharacterized protein with beta-barrel porin domain
LYVCKTVRSGRSRAGAWLGTRLFTLAILAAGLFGAAVTSRPALAACSNTSPGAGETVTCTGTETTPIDAGVNDTVTVNVLSGASITVGVDTIAILLNRDSSVTNLGAITAGDAVALFSGGIFFQDDNGFALNNGSIVAGNAAGGQVFGIRSFGDNATIINNNRITVGNASGPLAQDAIGIGVTDNGRVTNNGTITVGNFAWGIFGCCNNQVFNSAGALIQGGNTSYGIFAGLDGNTIANAGRIVVGDGTSAVVRSYGVLASGSNNVATNSGTVQTGNLGVGLAIDDPLGGGGPFDANRLTNAPGGVISVGNGSTGMSSGSFAFAAPTNSTLTNNGTIVTGNSVPGVSASMGIAAFGSAAITNTGTIATGNGDTGTATPVFGIFTFDGGVNVQNSGTISAGAVGRGIQAGGDGSLVINSGTIIGGASSTGVDVVAPNSGAAGAAGLTITNTSTGAIVVGNGGIGVNFQDTGSLNNAGLIKATGAGSAAINTCGGCAGVFSAVTNTGTLDGQVLVQGGGSFFTNNGLLTVTDSDIVNPVGAFAHIGGETFTQGPNGTLGLRVTGDGRKDAMGTSGVASTVTLNGGTLRALVLAGLYANTTTYLNAVTSGAGITGQFSSVTNTSAFFTSTATYNPQTIDLNLFRTPFGSVPGLTQNQQAVGNALEPNYSQNLDPNSNAGQFFSNLLAATSVAVLDQLSGEGTSALQNASFTAGSQFNNASLNQLVFGGGAGAASVIVPPAQYTATARPRGHEAFAAFKTPASTPAASQTGRWRVWTLGFGGHRSIDGNALPIGSANQTMHNYGGAIGVDHQLSPDLLLGFAAGGSESTISVSSLGTTGNVIAGHFGVYGLKTWGPYYAAASASYARLDNTTSRTITGVGPSETARGSFTSDQLSARLELGWRRAFVGFALTPFVAIEPAVLWARGYSETTTIVGGGAGVLGLNFASRTTTSLPTFLGLQADTQIILKNGIVMVPYGRASWVHEFEPSRQINAAFVSVPGAAFTVDGARPASDAARIDTGSRVTLDATRSLFANLSGEWSGVGQSYAAVAGFRLTP